MIKITFPQTGNINEETDVIRAFFMKRYGVTFSEEDIYQNMLREVWLRQGTSREEFAKPVSVNLGHFAIQRHEINAAGLINMETYAQYRYTNGPGEYDAAWRNTLDTVKEIMEKNRKFTVTHKKPGETEYTEYSWRELENEVYEMANDDEIGDPYNPC